jgi:nitrous oxidase accessory protein
MILSRQILFLLCFFGISSSMAKTIQVIPGNNHPITAAIQRATTGDSIMVSKGTYKEGNIIVDKPIFLIGINMPVLDGELKYETMTIKSDFVIIDGFHFTNSGRSSYEDIAALRIMQSGHILIRNNLFEHSFFGIYCQHAFSSTIYNNRFHSTAIDESSSANGIHCWKSEHMLIMNNEISGHRDGIYFEFVTNSTIQGNNSHGNARYGLHFMFSHDNSFIHNAFRDNGAGVAVMYSHGVSMINNLFADNWGSAAYGILMKDITDSRVEGNQFRRNTASIHMEGSNRINITGNVFSQNGWAIKIQASCTDNIIRGNNFINNTFDIATNGTLQLNNFTGNYWDKYEGFDLDRNGTGDIPFHPVSMYSIIVERNPASLILLRSFMSELMDKAEKVIPSLTPELLKDDLPSMHSFSLKTFL